MSLSQTNPITNIHVTGTCGPCIAIGHLQIINCKVNFHIVMTSTHLPKVPAVLNDVQTRMQAGSYSESSPQGSQNTRGMQRQPERREVRWIQ